VAAIQVSLIGRHGPRLMPAADRWPHHSPTPAVGRKRGVRGQPVVQFGAPRCAPVAQFGPWVISRP